jgi:molybdate transport system ATP-binding protein
LDNDSRTVFANVQISHRIGPLDLDVEFKLAQPWTILFGPSGSGKTTVLRAIAGFVRPDVGVIVADAGRKVLFDSARRIDLAPHERPVRIAAQVAKLFPTMSVSQNIVYGGGWLSKPQDELDLADQLLRLFRLEHLSEFRPDQLSGGEQQRASVARAILSASTSPTAHSLLLLDEPFNGVDIPVRDQLIVDLKAWLQQWRVPVLSVTHDVAEAFQLGAEVIKIADGKVVAQGPVEVVLAEERARLLRQLQP